MQTLSEYDVQANEFGAKNNVGFRVISHRFGSMAFDTDGQKRNIFKLELSRNKNKYVFEFGSSVADSCEKTSITAWEELKESDSFEVYCGIKSDKFGYASIKFNLTKGNASEVSDEQIKVWANELNAEIELVVAKYNSKRRAIEHVVSNSKYRTEGYVRNSIASAIKRMQGEIKTTYLNPKKEVVSPSLYDVLACLTKYDPGTFENFCSDFGYDSDSISALKTYKAVCKEWQKVDLLFGDVIDELQEIQ